MDEHDKNDPSNRIGFVRKRRGRLWYREIGRRIIPYLAQDPNIKLHGVTNSRVTVDDDRIFFDLQTRCNVEGRAYHAI